MFVGHIEASKFLEKILCSGYMVVSIWISLSLDPTRPPELFFI